MARPDGFALVREPSGPMHWLVRRRNASTIAVGCPDQSELYIGGIVVIIRIWEVSRSWDFQSFWERKLGEFFGHYRNFLFWNDIYAYNSHIWESNLLIFWLGIAMSWRLVLILVSVVWGAIRHVDLSLKLQRHGVYRDVAGLMMYVQCLCPSILESAQLPPATVGDVGALDEFRTDCISKRKSGCLYREHYSGFRSAL